MYRFIPLAFLAVCTGSFLQPSCPQHRSINTDHETLFDDLAQRVLELDKKVSHFNEMHSSTATKEIVEPARYVIEVPLKGYEDSDVIIKIRKSVLQINAKKGVKEYTQMRLLPTFANVDKSTYTLDEGVLQVVFPINNGPSTCNTYSSDSIKIVPKFELFTGQLGPRMGWDDE